MNLLHHKWETHTVPVTCVILNVEKLLRRWPPVFKIELHQIPSRRKTLTTNNIKGFLGHHFKPTWSQTFLSQQLVGNYNWLKLNALYKAMASSGKLIHLNWEKNMHTDLFAVETPRCLHPMKSSQVLIDREGTTKWNSPSSPKQTCFYSLQFQAIRIGWMSDISIQPWHWRISRAS